MKFLPFICVLLISCATTSHDDKVIEAQIDQAKSLYECPNGHTVVAESECDKKVVIHHCNYGGITKFGKYCPSEIRKTPCYDGSFVQNIEQCTEIYGYPCLDGTIPNIKLGEECPVQIQSITCWDGSVAESKEQCPQKPALHIYRECWDGSLMSDEPPYCPPPPNSDTP